MTPQSKSQLESHNVGGLELAPWEFAGLLLTYWCPARCAFCYVYSGPDRGGSMSVDTALSLWRSLDRLAAGHGKTMRIHLAGGEPFGDWVRLAALLRAARDAGLSPVEKIETNAFWATDDGLTRSRLELLKALGVGKLVVSWDIFHAEFVPRERVKRCVEIARRVLGRGGVVVRWWDFYQQPVDLRRLTAAEREQAQRLALERHRDRLTGRAADGLARLLTSKSATAFRGEHCRATVLQSRHVHIGPEGCVFPGTCGGIILGRADRLDAAGEAQCETSSTGCDPAGRPSAARTVEDVWQELAANWREHPIVDAVVAGGPHELLQRVKPLGYEELPRGYADKCHLCSHIRQFLVDRGIWPAYVGPPECYATPSSRRETTTSTRQRSADDR